MKTRVPSEINNRDICLYALAESGGDAEFVATEDVAVKAFELYPERFGLIRFPKYPDVDSVRVTLTDLRKEKYGSLVEGDKKKGWRITKNGVDWVAANSDAVLTAIRGKLSGERRISSGRRITSQKIRSSRLGRILNSAAFAKWKGGVQPSIYDFFDVLRIDSYTPEEVYREHLSELFETIPNGSDEAKFLRELATTYGGTYRGGS